MKIQQKRKLKKVTKLPELLREQDLVLLVFDNPCLVGTFAHEAASFRGKYYQEQWLIPF